MEEDIRKVKQLKNLLNGKAKQEYEQAIENLINENRMQRAQLMSAYDRGFIHKSKIKELIQHESFGVYIKPNGIIKVINVEALKELMEDK